MNETTYNTKLTNLINQINSCQSLIDEVNTMVPRSIDDIQVGTVSQTDNLDEVQVNIQTGSTMTMNPITGTNTPSSTWTINWILPRGKQGEEGPKGPIGEKGEQGDAGANGKRGLQGPWGKDCDKC